MAAVFGTYIVGISILGTGGFCGINELIVMACGSENGRGLQNETTGVAVRFGAVTIDFTAGFCCD